MQKTRLVKQRLVIRGDDNQTTANRTDSTRCWPGLAAKGSLCCFLMLCRLVSVQAEDWPQFRGPNCSGISNTIQSLPTEFSEIHNVPWSTKVGEGVGGPVVAAGRVFVSGLLDDQTVALFAFDSTTGEQLWMRQWAAGLLPEVHATNSHASTTPAADADHVYFYSATLGMTALDAQTGQDVWHQKLPEPYFVFKWGPAMSPRVVQRQGFVLPGRRPLSGHVRPG